MNHRATSLAIALQRARTQAVEEEGRAARTELRSAEERVEQSAQASQEVQASGEASDTIGRFFSFAKATVEAVGSGVGIAGKIVDLGVWSAMGGVSTSGVSGTIAGMGLVFEQSGTDRLRAQGDLQRAERAASESREQVDALASEGDEALEAARRLIQRA